MDRELASKDRNPSLALLGGPAAVEQTPPKFQWPPISERDIDAVTRLLEKGEISYYGREGEVARLEDRFTEFTDTRFAIATSSGTAALHSAFFALGLNPGEEILAPTYTFLATVMPIFASNCIPVLVDADPDTGNLDPADLERHLTPKTRAVVVTHLWGQPCDMRAIVDFCRQHGLKLVEDCSHAHGATCDDQPVGSFGDVAAFSLQGKKLVAAGQGGILVTSDSEIYERATLFGHFKVRCFQEVHSERYRRFGGTGFGLNYRMHPLAAALANSQFDRLEEYIDLRQQNFQYLSEQIAGVGGIEPPTVKDFVSKAVWYSYKPLYKPEEMAGVSIDRYVEALRAEGVDIERSDTKPLHMEPIFQTRNHEMQTFGRSDCIIDSGQLRVYKEGDFPGSEAYAKRTIVLPPYTFPAFDLLDSYVVAFKKVYENRELLAAIPANE